MNAINYPIICISNSYDQHYGTNRSSATDFQTYQDLPDDIPASGVVLCGLKSITLDVFETRMIGVISSTALFPIHSNVITIFKAEPGRFTFNPTSITYHTSSRVDLQTPKFTLVDMETGEKVSSSLNSKPTIIQLAYKKMTEREFFPPIFIPSHDPRSLNFYPKNNNTNFILKLEKGVRLNSDCRWNVALDTLCLSNGFFNVQRTRDYWFSLDHSYTIYKTDGIQVEDIISFSDASQRQYIPADLYRTILSLRNMMNSLAETAGLAVRWGNSLKNGRYCLVQYEPSRTLKTVAQLKKVNIQVKVIISPALARMLGFTQSLSQENIEIMFNEDNLDGLTFTRKRKALYEIDLTAGLPSECLVCCNLIQYSSIAAHQLQAIAFVPLQQKLLSEGETDQIEVYRFAPALFSRVKQHRLELSEIRIWITDLQGNILHSIPNSRPTLLSLTFSM